MKRAALAAACLAFAACGDGGGESGSCADVIVLHDDVYLAAILDGPDPPPGRPVKGGIRPGCNDGGGPEAGRPFAVREVRGIPPEVAVYPASGRDRMYVNSAYPTQVPEHPLHDRIHGSPDRPRLRVRGRRCRLDGEIESTVFSLLVGTGERTLSAGIDVRTRIDGFDRGGLPHFDAGDRVTIRGYGCHRDVMVARRIAPAP